MEAARCFSTLVLSTKLVNVCFHGELYGTLATITGNLNAQVVSDRAEIITLELREDLLLERGYLITRTRNEDEVVNVGEDNQALGVDEDARICLDRVISN
jgi:hypothetical protein